MDKNAIKSFAIESRRQMIESVKYQASLIGITSEGISEPISKAEGMETYDYGAGTYSIYDEDIQKRESLVREVNNKGFDNVVEEVAYTWFNRIIAIRFMEVNDYLPTRTRVLSSEIDGKIEPDIITDALDLDLNYTTEDKEKILKLKDENKLDELFRLLFVKQCNKLNEILPGLFEKTNDYMELLLNISFTDENGVIRKLINSISEEDFGNQVEIIGWLYQFYNTELKDETFANLKKGKKITKDRIPAATQLFTPDWIVKYMVENSVCRLWLDNHSNVELKSKWRYYIDEVKQDVDVEFELLKMNNETEILKPEEIKIIDPCMGSGHILVYIFEVLMDIYVSEGYTEKDASELILKHNIYGLDIDKRAYQLSYFAILMKARKYNRQILDKDIVPLVCPIEETNGLSEDLINQLCAHDNSISNDLKYIYATFNDAKEYGSVLKIDDCDFDKIIDVIVNYKPSNNLLASIQLNELSLLKNIVYQALILNQKYDVTITNPPYMGNKGMNLKLKNYLKDNFKDTQKDFSTVFMDRSFTFTKDNGFIAMINIPVWMFISSYENLRHRIIEEKLFINMLHLGRGIFGSDFGTVTFVLKNNFINNYKSIFKQLYEDKGAVESITKKENMFFANENTHAISQSNFNKIYGSPIAYWLEENMFNIFEDIPTLNTVAEPKQGLATSNNKKFLRFWYEVDINKTSFHTNSHEDALNSKKKWFACTKGGPFRKWYGNNDYVVDWENNGQEMKETVMKKYTYLKTPDFVIKNQQYYFKKGITWSTITNSKNSFRYCTYGFIPETKGSICYPIDENNLYYIIAMLNSNISEKFVQVLSPTIDLHEGPLGRIPFLLNKELFSDITDISKKSIELCKLDWDENETSWDFNKNYLLTYEGNTLEERFNQHSVFKNDMFNLLKDNEIKLNKMFCEIYNLDFDCDVEDKFISISKTNYENDIKSFISYAVGCMFGRYSLDNEGLQFAGGNFNINTYHIFVPDDDNIIPVLDTEYFTDDIVGRFIDFVKVCFGEENLEKNLDFIAGALNKKGKTSREIIRNYFLKDFFKDHSKNYNKCPIYWQFDSGKQNAFKCLIYMHRYDPSIIARVRTDYLHKTQKAIEQNMSHCDSIIANSTNKSEVSSATKDKSKYIKQLDEIKLYDEALRHMATQNIEIDLDEGVKENYKKFQKIEISFEGEKPKKINLLKNI